MSNVRNLPSKSLTLHSGIVTNFRHDELETQYLTLGQNVDAYDRFRTIGKVPGSTKVSDSHGAAVLSLHQFEYFGLDRVEARKQLSFAADGVLRLIDPSTGALTTLQSGLTSGTLRSAEMLNRLHLTSPEQRGLATGGIKYDGTRTTNWGVQAPGLQEVVLNAIDSSSEWTASTDGVVANSSSSIDGLGSVSLSKTGTSAAVVAMNDSVGSLNLSALGMNTFFIYLFLPYGVIQKLKNAADAVVVRYGNAGLTAYNDHNFGLGDLVPGWNLLSCVVTSPSSQTGGGASLASVATLSLRLNTLNSSQTFSGVLWDKMFSQVEARPSVALGSAGNPTGTYTYRVSFLSEFGVESNGSAASGSIVATSDQISLTAIPVSNDPQVIARRIYRDISSDGIYRFVDQIDDNTTTTYTDNFADASLGEPSLPLLADDILDNSPPGRLHAVAVYGNRIIGVDADDRFRLKISEIAGPEQFRLVDELVLEESIEAIENHAFGLLLYSTDSLFLMSGDGVSTPFRIEKVSDHVGSNSFRSVVTVKNIHMVQREAEVFVVANPADPWFINKNRLDHFREDITPSTRGDGFMIHDRSRYRVVLFNKGVSGNYDQLDVWQYGISGQEQVSGDGAGVDPQDLRIGSWFTLSLPSSINPRCAAMMERTADLPELWIGGNDGYVYWIGDTSKTSWAENTGTAAIDSQFETVSFMIGTPQGGRGEPRYLEINAEADAETVWSATVTLLSDADGASIATSTFNVTLGPGKTSVLVPVPKLGSRGEWARVKLSNATSAGVGQIRSLKLYYIPRGDFRGSRSA